MNRRKPRGCRAELLTNLTVHLSLYCIALFSLFSTSVISQDCTIPPEGFALICGNAEYYTFTPDEVNPPEVTPCPTLLNGVPIIFNCEGSAYDPGNPPMVPAAYYVWQRGDLYVIDPTVPCGQDNVTLVGTNLIAGMIAGSTLSFDNGMPTLWVVNDASPAILYEIDPTTGTVISSKPLQDCNGGGLNAVTEFSSIAYDPVGDRFIGLNVNSPEVIYNFNPADGCVFVCATAIFLGIPNPPNLEADGLSVGPDGTFYVSGSVDDELGADAVYSFMLPTCATFQLPPDSTVVATYMMTSGGLGTLALNSTACLQECPEITCEISNIVDALCSDTTDGNATATATGGSAPYTYAWSNGETTQTATMLPPGVPISVTITDSNDCEVICDEFMIGAPLPLSCEISLEQEIICDGDNTGELSIAVQGGTFPYFILWSNGETTSTITGLAPGMYAAEITDNNGCMTECSFELLPAPTFNCSTVFISDVSCAGLGDGSASVTVNGGDAPFTYNWTSGEITQTATGLEAGTQSVTVTDANMCETTCDVIINQPTQVTCSINVLMDIICAGDLTGSAEGIPMGGTAPYTYLWDNGETTAIAVMLDGGNHVLSVTDANMCLTVCSVNIADTSDLMCTVSLDQSVSCNGGSDGSATVTATGGTPGYTYLWDNGETTQTATALTGGLHEVTVTDQNDCSTICSITIPEPILLECSVMVNADLLCFGENIGSATAMVTGGTSPFQFAWDDGQTTATATGLDAGPISVTVTDANDCETICNGTITTPEELTCAVSLVSDISCFGEIDGSATAVPSGGTGPFTFLWSNGETTATASALPEGPNTVTVTDANMCVTECAIVIDEPFDLICVVNKLSDTLCEGESNGSGQAVPSGGTSPFTYLWDNGEVTATAVMLGPGVHVVTVTDANGCTTTCSVNIFGQSTLACSVQQDNFIECFGDMDAVLTATPSGGTSPYSYEWSTSQTTQTIMGVGPGEVFVTVTDANDCTTVCSITVTEPTELVCTIDLVQSIACFGDTNGSATITGTGGTPAYTYLWDNAETTATAVSLTAGMHTATITDANGCMSTCTIDIPGPEELTCTTTIVNNISCFGEDDGSATAIVVGGTPAYSFLWSTGETTATAVALIPGINTVIVTDANMCETMCTVEILEPVELLCTVSKLNDTLCEGESNGSAEVVPTGGTAPFTYLWDNGEITEIALMLAAGTRTVTVTDANGCVTNCSIEILGQSTLACVVQQDNFIDCFGDMDGELTAVPSGGNMPYTFAWSTAETTPTITGLGPGDYTVTVTDDNGCTTTCMLSITEPTVLVCTIDVNQGVACFGDTNGSATITGTGGTPSYTYLWDNNEITATAVSLTAGMHTATITDANGCMSTCSVDIPGPPELTCSTTIVNNITCFGDDDGSATVVVVGGTPGYTFLWSTGETDATAIALVPGTNSVTVTDANGCMTSCTVDIIEPPLLTCEVALVNDVLCAGEATGSATVVTTNGVTPFTFLWDNGETAATATMLSAGTHTVTVTDATGCITSCSIAIMDQAEILCIVSLIQNVSCNGGNDGSAVVSTVGGVEPYTYEWSNMETTATASALPAGTNTVTVTDANGCFTSCDIIIIEPTQVTCTVALENDISCFGADDGSATVSGTGGTPGYTYLWDNGETNQTAVALTPGLHIVTVTDMNDCETTCDITIFEPAELICTIALVNNISCFGQDDGSATVVTEGGTPMYTFLWDDGQTTATAIGLTPGPHSATVTDANGCVTSCDITIIEPLEFTCSVVLINDVLCAGDTNGSAMAVPNGGVAPFTYLWDNNETTATAVMLSGGSHVVTITDDTNCTTTCEIVIMDQSTLQCTVTLNQDVSCNGGDDGSATAVAIGGVGPFTYIWDNGEITATAVNLDAGIHTVTVNDTNNCGTTCTVNISEPLALGCSVALISDVICFGENNGSAIANPIGGTPGYTYLWDDGQVTQTATGLTPGLHIVTVTDMNLCETTCEITINEPLELLCSVSLINDISCFGENDGSAEAEVEGGTPDYTFLWDDGQTTAIAVNLTPGNHDVTVIDSQNCSTVCSIIIFEPVEFSCTVDLVNDVLCEGEVNGSATAVTEGGIGPFTYLWDNNETTATAVMLASGLHTVTVTDDTGCTTVCTINIMDQALLQCTVTIVQNVSCNGESDGSALVTPVGGVAPYSYLWSNVEITETAVNLAVGVNTVTVTDANGCTTSCQIIITEPPVLTCAVTLENNISCFGFDDGSATVTPEGGTPDYTYLWDDGQTTVSAINLTPGLHVVTVTDANLCETTCEITILEPDELVCTINVINDISCFGDDDGSATIAPLGGTPGYTFLWDDGQTTQTGINLTPGPHTATVTDANNCTTICTVTIIEPLEFTCVVELVNDVLCAGDVNGSATAIETGGVGPYTYLWDNNETTATAVMLSGGNHTVTVTDATGCTTECAIEIMDQSTLQCAVTLAQDVSCNGGADGSATANPVGGVGPFTYLWDNGEITATAVSLDAGTHTVTVNDTNNCGTTCTILIEEPPLYSCGIVLENDISCFGVNDGSATVTATGGTPGYTYLWDNNQTTPTATGLTPGLHTVTVTDANDCETICDITIFEPVELTCTISLENNISCFGANDGSATIFAMDGTLDYTYLWDDGQVTETAINLTPGLHTATVTDANSCETVCEITIIEPLEFTCDVVLINDVFCAGDLNGSATALPTGGVAPFTFLWDNNEVTATAVMLSGGNHTVTITDVTGCTTECAIEIMDQSTLECSVTLVQDVRCSGGADGSATALAIGGVGPFTYLWDNGETTATAVSLDAGTHTVTVNDTNNCGTTCTIDIAEPPLYSCSITFKVDISCFGENDGSATVTAVGGTPAYTYLWDDGQTTETATNLTPGLHTVTVTDANACPTVCDIIIDEPNELSCSVNLVNDISCFGANDGSATIAALGGVPGYTYLWDDGQTTETAINLTPGLHTATVTDASDCTTICSITINEPLEFSCTVTLVNNVFCAGDTNGSATAVETGGIGPFTYLWDNNETTATAVMLSGGNHVVTITDATGCTTICDIDIMDQSTLECTIDLVQNVSCFAGDDGSATANPVGGVGPFSYLWDNGETTATAVSLDAGTHTVTVNDTNNCGTTCTIEIAEPPAYSCSVALVNDINCFGDDDGSATVTAVGGTPGYTYLWDNNQTTATATGLTPGLHTVTVTDANDCETTCEITINEPAELTCSIDVVNEISCFGEDDGSATITVVGGTLDYTYLWDDGQTTQTAINLTPGIHTATVTDSNMCTTTCMTTIAEPAEFSCTVEIISNVQCAGDTNGSATVVLVGGVGPFTYLWDNNETSQTAVMLDGGSHTVTVTDATGCTTECRGIILDQSGLTCSISLVNDISCFGEDDGSATAIPDGGAGGYTYLWDNGETTQTAVSLSPGFHEVTVTDQNDCGTICNITIIEPSIITLTEAIVLTSLTCSGNDDGMATITVTGGTPDYTYLWTSGETTQTAVALQAGLGSVTVTDANLCTLIETFTIEAPEFPSIAISDIIPVSCPNFFDGTSNDGSATATVTGGIPGYTYLWSSGETTPTATMLVTGTNSISVTDAFGCQTVLDVDIPVDNCFSIDLEKTVEFVDPDVLVQVGSQLSYSFKVCNNGTVALSIVTVADPLVTVNGGPLNLAPGVCDETSFTGLYTITQLDLDRRFVSNQAVAMGFDVINNNPVSSNSDDPFTGAIDDPTVITLQAPAISLEKVADVSNLQNPAEPGDVINYEFTICNTGDLPLNGATVIDPTIDLIGTPIPTLLPDDCDEVSFTGSYVITSTDIALGFVENTALVTSTDPDDNIIEDRSDDPFDPENVDPNGDGNPDDPTIVLLEAVPDIELFKTGIIVSDCPVVGDLIMYSFEVCNTGNIDLTGITVTDANVTIIGGPISLESGACNNNGFVASYVLTQADIDRGFVDNSAMTQGMDANGTIVSDISDDPTDNTDVDTEGDGEADDVTRTSIIQKGEISLTKTGVFNDESGDGIAQPGESVSYSFVIRNIGNVTLTNVIVDDPLVTISGNAIPVLAVGDSDSLTFTGDYTLAIPDIDIALVDNTAQVTASTPDGQLASSAADSRVEYIVRTCDEIICNNDLQISLGASCELLLNEDQLIEDPVFGTYIISLFEDDEPFGDGGLLTEESIGKTLTYQVSCGLNSCWGTITVEANKLPEFDSPCIPGPDGEVDPDCVFACRNDERPNQIISEEEMTEILLSPCTPNLVGRIIVTETAEGDLCSENGTLVTVTYTGKFSIHDNITERHILTQKYTVLPIGLDEVEFPNDIALNCNSSTDPSVIAAVLQTNQLAFPTVFDDNFVPMPDSILACDSTQIEIILGTREVMRLQVIDGEDVWILETVVEKEFDFEIDSSSCRMVVDLESFEEVRFIPLDDRYCNLVSSYTDTEFANCGPTKKILRQWQVIDWCNPDVSQTSLQTIETIDNTAPVPLIFLNDVFVNIEPWSCTGVFNLPRLVSGIHYFEFCGGPVDITWDTEEGRVVDDAIIDLWLTNDPITVTVTYTDECGNQSFDSFRIVMQDLTRPVMVCNNNIQVLLTGTNDNGSATLFAADLDEGSHDAGCGLVDLQIIRAEDYEDPLFNCDNEFLGFEPVTCGALTQEVDAALLNGFEKNPDCSDSLKTEVSLAGDYIKFCCEDVGQSVEVILIATDKHGNTNQCRVEVFVGEKLLPRLVCPTVEVDCSSDEMVLPIIEGSICSVQEYEPILMGEVNESTNCLDATILREWYIDLNANGELDEQDPSCQQNITIAGQGGVLDPYTIKWPKNYDGTTLDGLNIECDDEGVAQEQNTQVAQGASMECIAEDVTTGPVWCHTNCSLVGTSLATDTITSSEACLTIIKRWTVVDWCTWDSNQSDVDDENDRLTDTFVAVEDWAQFNCDDCQHSNIWTDNVYFRYESVDPDGYYTFDQIIRIEDQTAPEILAPLDYLVSTSAGANTKDEENSCLGSETITVKATDMCGGQSANASDLTWTIVVTKDGEEIASKTAQGEEVTMNTQEGQPGDVHTITWIAQDACGNQSSISTVVEFGDESAPTPFCVIGLTSNLPDANGDVVVWSNEFDFGSFDNCTATEDLRFSIMPSGQDPILPGETGFDSQSSLLINCDDFNQSTELDVWVWDSSGNGDLCTVLFTLSESCGEVLTGAGATIAGKISTSYDEDLSEVLVTLISDLPEYPKSELSNENGQYAFFSNPLGANYAVTPQKDGDDTNGLSTVDLVFIQRHIVGISPLNDPYKVIASDANNDQRVSATDILELRRLILTYQDEFSNTDSWRFVDKTQTFFDVLSPWPFIEEVTLVDLQNSSYGLDFIAVKIGDINLDASVNGIKHAEIRSSETTFTLSTDDQQVSADDILTISLTTTQATNLHGFQYTLDHQNFELLAINSGLLALDESNYASFNESTTFSWNTLDGVETIDETTALFTITLKAKADATLSKTLSLNSSRTKAEAYLKSVEEISPIELVFNSAVKGVDQFELYQNQPNPFEGSTVISFNLPEESSGELTLYTISGQVVKSLTGQFIQGYNEITIDSDRLPVSGVLYYQLQTPFGTKTMKMIVLD